MASKYNTLNKDIISRNINKVYDGIYKVKAIKKNESARDYTVDYECTLCGCDRSISYRHLLKGSCKCKCMNPASLKKTAKEYARSLYIEPERGLLVGQELITYIKQSIAYDYPFFYNNQDFIFLVEDELLKVYEKKGVCQCKRCKRWYPKTMYKKTTGNICDNCRTGALLWI